MIILSAKWIHESFSRSIKIGEGIVYSCYHHVLNFMTDDGLLTILSSEIPCAPKALQLTDSVNFLSINVKLGTQVSFIDPYLLVGNKMLVDLEYAKPWKCSKIIPININKSDALAGIASVNKLILKNQKKYGACRWYQTYIGKNVLDTKDSIELALHRRINDFIHGWHIGDLTPVEKLIGVGYGLTPSGDDFLCGFYFTIYQLTPKNIQASNLRAKVLSLKKHMSEISSQMIDTYFNGEGNELFYQFLNAVLLNDIIALNNTYQGILKFGSTSGLDIMVGILTGLRFIFSQS